MLLAHYFFVCFSLIWWDAPEELYDLDGLLTTSLAIRGTIASFFLMSYTWSSRFRSTSPTSNAGEAHAM
jgi:hypothetical protein